MNGINLKSRESSYKYYTLKSKAGSTVKDFSRLTWNFCNCVFWGENTIFNLTFIPSIGGRGGTPHSATEPPLKLFLEYNYLNWSKQLSRLPIFCGWRSGRLLCLICPKFWELSKNILINDFKRDTATFWGNFWTAMARGVLCTPRRTKWFHDWGFCKASHSISDLRSQNNWGWKDSFNSLTAPGPNLPYYSGKWRLGPGKLGLTFSWDSSCWDLLSGAQFVQNLLMSPLLVVKGQAYFRACNILYFVFCLVHLAEVKA